MCGRYTLTTPVERLKDQWSRLTGPDGRPSLAATYRGMHLALLFLRRCRLRHSFTLLAVLATILCTGSVQADQPREITGKDGAPMVLVPAGEFLMGSDERASERPVHQVYLDAFFLDKFEVTTTRYGAFLAATGQPKPEIGRAHV